MEYPWWTLHWDVIYDHGDIPIDEWNIPDELLAINFDVGDSLIDEWKMNENYFF